MQTATRSIWARPDGARSPSLHPPLTQDGAVDVVVVGAGITGLTTALLLARAGSTVAVVERDRVGSGTTGRSTAHLTVSLDVPFAKLISRFGEAAGRTVVESVVRAIDEIERLAAPAGCAFRRVPGFRFAERAADAADLAAEIDAARRLGIAVEDVAQTPLPFPVARAMRFADQAQMDPLAYVRALAEQLIAAGGAIYEHAPVVEANVDGVCVEGGARLRAAHVVEATQTPLGLVASIQTRVAATTSYVLEAALREPLAAGLYWDTDDPYHYVRTVDDAGLRILAGGEDHGTGRERNPAARLGALEAWTREHFPVAEIFGHWSHEHFEPADGLPYIGLLPGSRSHWIAAGFAGTGLTFGTVAALMLRDLVTVGSSPWESVYTPSRLKPLASGLPIAKENLSIGWRFIADRLKSPGAAADLPPDSGRVEREGRRQVAVYRDLRGDLHFLSARCPHLGCVVAWNEVEKTWDCPCHGGRFAPTGKVLYGPPTGGLEHLAADGAKAEGGNDGD
jgi:glycine/D-amino acid oxidase-like deaminating enzyme/nitrite reductase/ring-hydroxylating ferredoxin subunit